MAIAAITVAATPTKGVAGPPDGFAPDFDKAVLRIGTRTLPVVQARPRTSREHVVGALCMAIDGPRVIARLNGKISWQSKADTDLAWITYVGNRAYLTSGHSNGVSIAAPRQQIRSLDLEKGLWSEPITLIHEGQEVGGKVWGIVEVGNGVAVAAEINGGTLLEYFPHRDDGSKARPAWEQVFAPGDLKPPDDAAFLMASRRPDRGSPGSVSLLMVGGKLVVCTGPTEPLRGVTPANGNVAWTLARPWEFQRGFIGPSVWSHTLTRFGLDNFAPTPQSEEKARAAFDAERSGTMIAGPAGDADGQSFFIATARGPRNGWTNYLLEPSVLEVSGDGSPTSLAPIPRRPLGAEFACHGHQVVWSCQGYTLLCVSPSDPALMVGMGPGGPDLVTNVEWMRRYELEVDHKDWMAAPGLDNLVAFGSDFAYCSAGGMSVRTEQDAAVHFPLARIELATGALARMTLEVPFSGAVPVPQTNLSISSTPDGHKAIRPIGPYLVSVTAIDVGATTLLVTVGEEDKATILEFAVDAPAKP
jgi:hypothetical protein